MQSKATYALWIALMIFTEGGHFTLVPNVLRIIFGEKSASILYGVVFSFTGVSQVMIICIVLSQFGKNYLHVYYLMGGMSVISLLLLLLFFKEKRIYVKDVMAK